MKKKYLKKFLVLTLILTLCTTTMLSGTLAAYTSEESGTATVTAAQFKLDADVSAVDEVINLGYTKNSADTATDGDYYGTGATLFPGQSGYFTVDASFVSDVDATITTVVSAELTPTYGEGNDGNTITATATETLLDATALRFYIISEADIITNSAATDAASITAAIIAATAPGYGKAYTYSTFEEGLASTLFADNYSTSVATIDGYTVSAEDGKTVYQYNASAESATVALGGTVYYVYWDWAYTVANITYSTDDGAANSTYTTTVVTSGVGDGSTEVTGLGVVDDDTYYYTYSGTNYANLSSIYDILDTAWGNAITVDLAAYLAENDSTVEGTLNSGTAAMTGYDVIFNISISATQEATAFTDPD